MRSGTQAKSPPAPTRGPSKTAKDKRAPLVAKAKAAKLQPAPKPAPKKPAAQAAPRAKPAATVAARATPAKLAAKPATAKSAVKNTPKPVLDSPAKIRPIEQAVGVTSEAVARRTGKSWAEWFALLDAAGAAELDHKGIVAVLAQRHGVGPWWQQMVTVAYEQARGKRDKDQTPDGYQMSVSRTLDVPLGKLFKLWLEPSERNKWLGDDRFTINKATASKSIRARWGRGTSRIDVSFSDKGAGKAQVTVQHHRIEGFSAAEQMKAYWAKKLGALEELVTSS